MSEPHLYTVAGDGTATEAAPDREPKRSRPGARPKKVVPTSRMSVDKQVLALRAICTESRQGAEAVSKDALGAAMGLSPATATLNNAFFIDAGLIAKEGRAYKPLPIALSFARDYSFEGKAAFAQLRPTFERTWYAGVVRNQLELHGGAVPKAKMIHALASAAETDEDYARELGFALDWLELVGIIVMEGDTISPASAAAPDPADGGEGDDGGGGDGGDDGVTPDPPPGEMQVPTDGITSTFQAPPDVSPAVISLSVEIKVTADDLARLAPDQIAALFEGAGKVAAAQAALRD